MFIAKNSINDIIFYLLKEIMNEGYSNKNSKGENREKLGIHIRLENPRKRISTALYKNLLISPLGELMWYLSGSDKLEFIEHYIPIYSRYSNDKIHLNGAYGSRIFGKNNISQFDRIISILNEKPNSRQAVIQIYDKEDICNINNLDVPCTCTLQFFIRENKLIMYTHMRSNDIFVGLPHDIFCFTMIQEIVARELNVDIGDYNHFIGSAHIYKKDFDKVKGYLDEGFQSSKIEMPPMPIGSQWNDINLVLENEEKIRNGIKINYDQVTLSDYWKDILIVLNIFTLTKAEDNLEICDMLSKITNPIFRRYLKLKYVNN